jgi:hypothetical protein
VPTPPTATGLTAAIKKTLTSTAFSRLFERAVHTAVEELRDQDRGSVVLLQKATPNLYFYEFPDHRAYWARSLDGRTEFRIQMDRTPRSMDRYGRWYGTENRVDSEGREWSRRIPDLVQDDFGFLVEVAA